MRDLASADRITDSQARSAGCLLAARPQMQRVTMRNYCRGNCTVQPLASIICETSFVQEHIQAIQSVSEHHCVASWQVYCDVRDATLRQIGARPSARVSRALRRHSRTIASAPRRLLRPTSPPSLPRDGALLPACTSLWAARYDSARLREPSCRPSCSSARARDAASRPTAALRLEWKVAA